MTEYSGGEMANFKHDLLEEVYQRKAHVLEKFGGFDGFMNHLDENRPQLIAEGWHFINPEDLRERNLKRQLAELDGYFSHATKELPARYLEYPQKIF